MLRSLTTTQLNYSLNIENDPNLMFEGEVNMETVDYDGSLDHLFRNYDGCTTLTVFICGYNGSAAGNACWENDDPHIQTSTLTVCLDNSAYEVEFGGGGSGGGSGGGESGGGSTQTNYVTDCQRRSTANDGIANTEGCAEQNDETDETECTDMSALLDTINAIADTSFRNEALLYMSQNNSNCEAIDFLLLAIEAHQDGGEVDFGNKVIYSQEFKQTKAYCVIKLLTETNNNLFHDVISTFTSNRVKNKIKFHYGPIFMPQGSNDTTTEANTSEPDSTGLITITFNSFTNSAFENSLSIATNIFHESIHANLFRIVGEGNNGINPLPDWQFEYLTNLLNYYEQNGSPMFINSNAQHTFMANFHVGKITTAVRQLDGNLYTDDHYKAFGWTGLSDIGRASTPPLVTNADLANYNNLASLPLNDNHNLSCDE